MKHLNWSILVVMIFSIPLFSIAQKEKEVKVKMEDEILYGSLISVSEKSKAPVVIIIPGSGPTDRNGNSMMVQANSYRMLAEELAEHGIASLRYDKLMVGKSKSDKSEGDLRFQDNVDQVNAWIDYLKKKKYTNIILIGHSEGSLIGMLASQQREVNKFISFAGTGRSIDEVLIEQITAQSPGYTEEVKRILLKLKKGEEVDDFNTDLASLFRKSVQPYLISWLKYSPQEEIQKLEIPTLILHGTSDIQVSEEDAVLQHEANPEAELKIIDGMNHIFKAASENREENIQTYLNPKLPLHEELIPVLTGFILE